MENLYDDGAAAPSSTPAGQVNPEPDAQVDGECELPHNITIHTTVFL